MKERVRFAVGAASMVLAACCLIGALFTAWLRCAAGAVTQAAGWAVMQQLDLKEQPWVAGTGLQAGGTPHRVTLAALITTTSLSELRLVCTAKIASTSGQ